MAERRMFAKTIIDSDAFLDMPMSARLLYYDLAMRADDDGFVNSPKKIMRIIGATPDDLNVLVLRKFVIAFETGVVCIKHWLLHNYIRKDTYNETKYKEEKATLALDENKAYTQIYDLETARRRLVDGTATQERVGKVREGKVSVGKVRKGEEREAAEDGDLVENSPAPQSIILGEYHNVILSAEELAALKEEYPDAWGEMIDKLSGKMASKGYVFANHYATMRQWAKEDAAKPRQGGRTEPVPAWMRDDMDEDARYEQYRANAQNDPAIRARIEALQQSFSEREEIWNQR